MISLGSGGLLTEYFINKSLKNSGYKDLNWRIIDPDYQNNGYEQCRKEFKDRVNGKVMAFTTEQTYLNKSLGHSGLADNDKIAEPLSSYLLILRQHYQAILLR